jgi:uncharacterized protein (DUF1330 family)
MEASMPAYLISICRGVTDRAKLEQYWTHSRPTFEGFNAQLLAVYTQVKPLEAGGPVEGVVLVEFPSMESATRWYESPAYQEVRKYRIGAAEFEIILVDGGLVDAKDRMPGVGTKAKPASIPIENLDASNDE